MRRAALVQRAQRRQGLTYKPLREGDALCVGVGLATRADAAPVRALRLRLLQGA